MKPTTKLISALHKVADGIETGEIRLDWGEHTQCYCGVLAKELINIDDTTLERELYNYLPMIDKYGQEQTGIFYTTWSEGVEAHVNYCRQSKLPYSLIFQQLLDTGLEEEDFREVEYLGGILSGVSYTTYIEIEEVVDFFRTKAKELESQLINNSQKVKTSFTQKVKAI